MKNILLLTATIQPKSDQPKLTITNVDERLADYKKSLAFYSTLLQEKIIDKIIFVDNSGYDLTEIKNINNSNKIEWISFYGLDVPSDYHRGYGEFKLIDYAYKTSEILTSLDDADIVWKITGRYIIKNLNSFIRRRPIKFDIYCNISHGCMSMEIIGWKRAGYNNIIKDVCENFKGNRPPELILSDMVKSKKNDAGTIKDKYFWPPMILGRRGGDGTEFQGRRSHIKFKLNIIIKLFLHPLTNIIYPIISKDKM